MSGAGRGDAVSARTEVLLNEQVFQATLRGLGQPTAGSQYRARVRVGQRANVVRAFLASTNLYPWHWSAALVDERLGDLRAVRNLRRHTLRNYQTPVRLLCNYLTDRAYD